jgi:hypothetical protein
VRARGVFFGADRKPLRIGGKTGTGDNRFESFGPGHQLIESRLVDRTATFVFFVGDRLYGTVTAFVPGAQAANYHFTSSLAVSFVRALAPELRALIDESADKSVEQPQLATLSGEAADPLGSAPKDNCGSGLPTVGCPSGLQMTVGFPLRQNH